MKPSHKTPTKDDSKQNHFARKKLQTQIHNNHNKCKTIITIPGFVLHKLGVCIKPAKNQDQHNSSAHLISGTSFPLVFTFLS